MTLCIASLFKHNLRTDVKPNLVLPSYSRSHNVANLPSRRFLFNQFVQEHGIDTNDYPPEAISELCNELYEVSPSSFMLIYV